MRAVAKGVAARVVAKEAAAKVAAAVEETVVEIVEAAVELADKVPMAEETERLDHSIQDNSCGYLASAPPCSPDSLCSRNRPRPGTGSLTHLDTEFL